MGEEQPKSGFELYVSYILSIPLPPFVIFKWGKDGMGVALNPPQSQSLPRSTHIIIPFRGQLID
jgi:hypothetical protein